jgi:hypothetical protein
MTSRGGVLCLLLHKQEAPALLSMRIKRKKKKKWRETV